MFSFSRYEVAVVVATLLIVALNTGFRAWMHAHLPEVGVVTAYASEVAAEEPQSPSHSGNANGPVIPGDTSGPDKPNALDDGGNATIGDKDNDNDASVDPLTSIEGVVSSPLGKIDINTAQLSELITLPGIGPALAGRILAYREERGPFKSVHELLNVKGIGVKRLESIAPLVWVGGSDH